MEETKLSDNCEMSFAQCVVSRPPACIMKLVVSRRNSWDSSAVLVISDSPRWHSILTTQAPLLPSTYKRAVFRYSNSGLSMFVHSPHLEAALTIFFFFFCACKARPLFWVSAHCCHVLCLQNYCLCCCITVQVKEVCVKQAGVIRNGRGRPPARK